MEHPLYTAEQASELAGNLSIHDVSDTACDCPKVSGLEQDYMRARMLLASMLTNKHTQDNYITRLEKLNDQLLNFKEPSL